MDVCLIPVCFRAVRGGALCQWGLERHYNCRFSLHRCYPGGGIVGRSQTGLPVRTAKPPDAFESGRAAAHVLEIAKVEAVLVADQRMAASLEQKPSMLKPKLILKMSAHGSPQPGRMGIQTLFSASYCQHLQCPRELVIRQPPWYDGFEDI